ncbi:hypothetical protein MMC30_001224 [Trapelia coarctata]|nr:hypothetical protein [Trapelia coarctata]
MRTFLPILALASTFLTVLSAPTPEAAALPEKDKKDVSTIAIITDLTGSIQPHLAAIQSTAESITPQSSPSEKDAATSALTASVGQVVSAVNAATAQVVGLKAYKKQTRNVEARQAPSPTAIGQAITALLVQVSTALNGIIAALGLTATLGIAQPLTIALSNLLLALAVVVDDLLIIVRQLVDGLLIGLSAALAGLVL